MRENRLYGSEGGAGVLSLRSYPYPGSWGGNSLRLSLELRKPRVAPTDVRQFSLSLGERAGVGRA